MASQFSKGSEHAAPLPIRHTHWNRILKEEEGSHILWVVDTTSEKEEEDVPLLSIHCCDMYAYKCLITIAIAMFLGVIAVIIYIAVKKDGS
jgi:hypothetical protein